MLVSFENISKVYNGKAIFADISQSIEDGEKIGMVGPNGEGKTTLLRIITGEILPDSGNVYIANNSTIGYLKQNSGTTGSNTIYKEMLSAFAPVLDAEKRMKEIAGKEEYLEEYGRLQSYFEVNEGYNLDAKIKTVLGGMGFADFDAETSVATLSGGEKTRLALAKILLTSPDLLILDEPTNHLDFAMLSWLEGYIKTFKGAVLIVSHDRYFLDNCCSRIFDLGYGRLISYTGNYSAYKIQSEERKIRELKEFNSQQEEIAKLQTYIDKNKVRASTAKMAKSREKQLDKMEVLEKPRFLQRPARFKFTYSLDPVKDVLAVKNVPLIAGDTKLMESVNFEMKRGDRIAIIGANGCGKSTLIKTIQNIYPKHAGVIKWGDNVKYGYFDQEGSELRDHLTAAEEIHSRFPSMTDLEVRNKLASVLITGENVFKLVGNLSDGERARVYFAVLMLQNPNVLILDEPTNHLDLATKEVLEKAFIEFEGTMLMVSHDRYFLNKIPNKIMVFEGENLVIYEGNFDRYTKLTQVATPEEEKPQRKGKTTGSREERAKLRGKISQLNKMLKDLEDRCDILEAEIINPEICSNYSLLDAKCTELEQVKAEIDETLIDLIESTERLDEITK